MGQATVQRRQLVHASLSARKRKLGQARVFRKARPRIMNGAIQQMV